MKRELITELLLAVEDFQLNVNVDNVGWDIVSRLLAAQEAVAEALEQEAEELELKRKRRQEQLDAELRAWK